MDKAYAQALWRIVEGGKEPKKAVRALREALISSGREALLPRIARAFARIADRNTSQSSVVVSVAREKDSGAAIRQSSVILKELGTSPKDLKTRVDDTLIGGWRLEGKGTLVDNSYKKHLLSVYNRLTN